MILKESTLTKKQDRILEEVNSRLGQKIQPNHIKSLGPGVAAKLLTQLSRHNLLGAVKFTTAGHRMQKVQYQLNKAIPMRELKDCFTYMKEQE